LLSGRERAHKNVKDDEIGSEKSIGDGDESSPRHARDDGGEERIGHEHGHKHSCDHPGEIFDPALGADIVSDRADDVIAAEDNEIEKEPEPHRPHFIGAHIDCAVAQTREKRAHCYRGSCRIRNTEAATIPSPPTK